MKSIALSSILLAISSFAVIGCGSGQDRTSATADATAAIPAQVMKTKQELDQVVGALKGARDASDSADLKKIYGDLKAHAAKLDKSLADVESGSDSAVEAGKTQIAQWHKAADAFSDADLRNASNQRESELRQSVDQLAASAADLKNSGNSYSSALGQALNALDLDLSQPGIQAMKPVIAKLVDNEPALRGRLSEVADKSRSVNRSLNP